ncbi:Piso0_001723 [Millerozyma farinosa CBS 7064]|uniref:Alpha-1,3-glucosyltransferase n=1 Tax=Pichia sorbitophila (strain ATCC MYA-4447 / BCRC 22081 / CBS 7064 / NBRC 10061 / NRRL Y-12695) TaxID=559304 RepID=G8YLJ6_PICSO|nr:Piso0_001723 [Millerozyma farinosa CBS 7064]
MGNPGSKKNVSKNSRQHKQGKVSSGSKRGRPVPSSTKKESVYKSTVLYGIFKNFERAPDQWEARYILILTAIILRAAVGLAPYSGMGEKPINGDFEAQRHWMELTIHLPIDKWYFYDLQYWGLDYPPLTAFHSYLLGKLGSLIRSDWFAFVSSRGLESVDLKTYMRYTSILSELIVFIPAVIDFVNIMGKKVNLSRMDQILVSAIIITQPSLILIDHGHFQYNSVMLGSFLFSLTDIIKGNYIFSAIWFICSVNFKQMALYYAPFIFAYLFSLLFKNYYDIKSGRSVWKVLWSFDIKKLFLLGITVIITNLIILLPFVIFGPYSIKHISNVLLQILKRVFPFERGLFEDKVANFWCTTNIVVKYKEKFTVEQVARLSLVTTLATLIVPCSLVMYKMLFKRSFSTQSISSAKEKALLYGFTVTSWLFYLFSFLVHEKTVLVPLLPSTLLVILNDSEVTPIVQWINNVATFSLWPLLKKESIILQYVATLFLINWLVGNFSVKSTTNFLVPKRSLFWKVIIISTYIAMLLIHFVDACYAPPSKYPDLWVLLNTTLSFGCFSLFCAWSMYKLYVLT